MTAKLHQFLEDETMLLRQGIGEAVAQWPKPYPDLTRALIEKARFRSDAPASEGWSQQFDPLTLLYPLLHLDLLHGTGMESMRPWGVLHGLYLIHSILNDRVLDGQVAGDARLILYDKLVLIHAERSLHAMTAQGFPWWRRLHHDYVLHQDGASLKASTTISGRPATMRELEEAAYGRAALGFMATSGMLAASNCPEELIEAVLGAYKPLVIALQWCDDFEDWSEDLAAGRSNLMLARLQSCCEWEDGSADRSPAQIRKLLVLTSSPSYALRRAAALLHESSARYQELGASMLARMIRHKAGRVAGREKEHAEGLTREIIRCFGEILVHGPENLAAAMS